MKLGVLLFLALTFQGIAHQPLTTSDSTKLWLKSVRIDKTLTTDQKKILLDKALKETLNSKPSELYRISGAALKSGDSALFKNYSKKIINLSTSLNEGKSHAFAHWDLGDFFKENTPDSAYYHYNEAYTVFSNMDLDSTNILYPGKLLLSIASLQDNIKDYVGAEKNAINAIDYFQEVNKSKELFAAYNQLGIALSGMNKLDKAIEYYEKAREFIPLHTAQKQRSFELSVENNIAVIYLRKENYPKAFELYSQLVENEDLLVIKPQLYAKVLGSKAITGFKAGLINLNELEKDIENSNRVLDSLDNRYTIARNYFFHAEALTMVGDTLNAIEQANEAKEIAYNTKNNDRLLKTFELLITIDKENSAAHFKSYNKLSKTIQQKERIIQDKFARVRMETDTIIEENEKLARQKEIIAGIALVLLVLGIGVFTIVSQRVSNQKLKFKQKEQNHNQEIYNLMLSQHGKLEEGKKFEKKRVSEELHDGILGQMLGIRLILSGLNERTDESAIEQRAELIQKMQELEEEVRTISHELNEAAYEKVHKFMASIQDLIHSVQNSAAVSITLNYCKNFSWDTLSGDTKIHIYRIVQECLQNCIKHSHCKNIQVSFQSSEKTLLLNISDDGIGFDINKRKKGIGLRNIISRVKKIGGILKINSNLNEGTKIDIQFEGEFIAQKNPKTNPSRTTIQEEV